MATKRGDKLIYAHIYLANQLNTLSSVINPCNENKNFSAVFKRTLAKKSIFCLILSNKVDSPLGSHPSHFYLFLSAVILNSSPLIDNRGL